jgi:hypothetical protein
VHSDGVFITLSLHSLTAPIIILLIGFISTAPLYPKKEAQLKIYTPAICAETPLSS